MFSFYTGLKRQQAGLHTPEERQAAPISPDTPTGGLVKAAAPPTSSSWAKIGVPQDDQKIEGLETVMGLLSESEKSEEDLEETGEPTVEAVTA